MNHIIISCILGLANLLISRYSGRELEKCNNTGELISLWVCLIFAWLCNSFFIWFTIEFVLLQVTGESILLKLIH